MENFGMSKVAKVKKEQKRRSEGKDHNARQGNNRRA
jgi:hypothetical protein